MISTRTTRANYFAHFMMDSWRILDFNLCDFNMGLIALPVLFFFFIASSKMALFYNLKTLEISIQYCILFCQEGKVKKVCHNDSVHP